MVGLLSAFSCTPVAFQNNTASLGGDVPGDRSDIRVQFINNTPFRAIFTFGAYDPQNPNHQPADPRFFQQSFVGEEGAAALEGNSTSNIITFECARVVSIGGDALIQFIQDQGVEAEPVALQPGITFSNAPLDSPDVNAPTAGRSPGVVTFQGAQFQCDSLLVYTFNPDPAEPSGVRIDLQVILP